MAQVQGRGKSRGQGMVEYAIIVALIAVAAIGVVTIFGDNIRSLFAASAQAIAGKTDVQNQGDNSDHSNLRRKTLKTFGQNQ
jgi:pilus assembly protein Flp/PilA